MVKVADLSVGKEITTRLGPITRAEIKVYGKGSKDTNAIHMNDAAAVLAKLKGVIQHGMLSYAHVMVYVDEWLQDTGKMRSIASEMRGMVRPGDWLEINFKVTSIEGNIVKMDFEEYSITPIHVKKDDEKVLIFEAEEREWVTEKDIKRDTVKEKEITEPMKYLKVEWDEIGFPEGKYTESIEEYSGSGTLKYRYRLAILGSIEIELDE
ncbi:MAG: MaoC family dehydratase [Candidatus Hodarchaeota archaeon]